MARFGSRPRRAVKSFSQNTNPHRSSSHGIRPSAQSHCFFHARRRNPYPGYGQPCRRAGHARRGHYRPRLHVWRARPSAGLRRRQPQHARVQNLEPRQGLLGKGPPRRAGGARSRGKPARACPVCEGHGHVGREGQHRRAQAAPGHQAHLWLRGLLYAGRDARPRPQARALPHDPSGQGPGGLRQPDADGLRGRCAGLLLQAARDARQPAPPRQGHDLHERLHRGHHPQIHRPRRQGGRHQMGRDLP